MGHFENIGLAGRKGKKSLSLTNCYAMKAYAGIYV
jgi:hypothetical protein